ncbi:hypothetical protein ACFL6C_13380 [Myxococcota bacterium]
MSRCRELLPTMLMASLGLASCTDEEGPNDWSGYYGDPGHSGDPRGDDGLAGDEIAGDRLAGDELAGDPRTAGDPWTGDSIAGDTSPGDRGWLPGDASCVPGDWGPGSASVEGTRLEHLELQWPASLELCNQWQENETLAVEKARKIRITLPPQSRPSLADVELGRVAVYGALIERSPFAADRWRLSACSHPAEIVDHSITDTVSYTQYQVRLIYDLGAAGRLHEVLSVWRNEGDTSPIIYSGDPWDNTVTFHWEAPGGAPSASLTACDGGPHLHEEVDVISAFDGSRSLTILRGYRTAFAMAGSFPVHLVAAQAVFSDEPWNVHEAHGFWSQTYAAQHHNWFEDSVIDFWLDPRPYHMYFKPGAAGSGERLGRIDLEGISGWDNSPSLDAVYVDLQSAAERSQPYPIGDDDRNWRSVGDTSLTMVLNLTCSDGEILTLGWAVTGYWQRFLTCPRAAAPGFYLVALVPVVFALDAHHVGHRFQSDAITPTTVDSSPGFEVDLGNATVRIWETPANRLGVDVRNQVGTEVYSNIWSSWEEARQATVMPSPPMLQTLIAENETAGVSMRLVRAWAAQGVGNSAIYVPISFELTFAGWTHMVDAYDALDYTNTHHNHYDSLKAFTATHRLFWADGGDMVGGNHTVRVETIDSIEVLPPTEVTPL